jgi:hypothetical protein
MRPPQTYYYWVKASFWDTKKRRTQSAFSGWWASEREAFSWATAHYASMPGSNFEVIRSTSRDRNVARNQERHEMVESGDEGNIAEVLDIRFSDHNKKES